MQGRQPEAGHRIRLSPIAAEIDGAVLHIVPGLKHLGLIEAPEQFTAPLVEFLSDFLGK